MPEFLGRVYGLGGAGGQVPGGGGRRHYSLLYQVRLSPLKCFIYNARWKTIQNVVTLHVLSNRYCSCYVTLYHVKGKNVPIALQ